MELIPGSSSFHTDPGLTCWDNNRYMTDDDARDWELWVCAVVKKFPEEEDWVVGSKRQFLAAHSGKCWAKYAKFLTLLQTEKEHGDESREMLPPGNGREDSIHGGMRSWEQARIKQVLENTVKPGSASQPWAAEEV